MIQQDIIINLLNDELYFNKFITKFSNDSFIDEFKVVFDNIQKYHDKYKKIPSAVELKTEIIENVKYDDQIVKDATSVLKKKYVAEEYNEDWIKDKTVEFIKNDRLEKAISKCIEIQSKGNVETAEYREIMETAFDISFDDKVGYDYLENLEERFEHYKIKQDQFPMPVKEFNEITDGGVKRKTLNVLAAGTGVGKSMFLCNFARYAWECGRNVVYITLEMAEEEIGKRVDSAFSNIDQNELKFMQEKDIEKLRKKLSIQQKDNFFKIQEFPTGSACANDFKQLIKNIEAAEQKKVDMLVIDYIGIIAPNKNNAAGLYEKGKQTAEELRALAVEFDIPVWTAQQLNRGGANASSLDTGDLAESYAIASTSDLILGLIEDEELLERQEIRCKQIKNRYNSKVNNNNILIKVNKAIAKIFYDAVVLTNAAEQPVKKSFVPSASNKAKTIMF